MRRVIAWVVPLVFLLHLPQNVEADGSVNQSLDSEAVTPVATAPGGGGTSVCGDGIVESPETCDPPGAPAGGNENFCRADCTVCGDSIPHPLESCDDGNGVDNDACRNDCTPGTCGNDVVDPGAGDPSCDTQPPADMESLYDEVRALSGQDSLPGPLASAVASLEARSRWLVVHADGLRVRSLHGLPLGNVTLADPLDPQSAYPAVLEFLETYADVFRLTSEQLGRLPTEFTAGEARVGDHVRVRLEQFHQGVRIRDGGFAMRFLPNGQLHSMWGSPYSASDLPADVTPQIPESTANGLAIAEVSALLAGGPYATGLVATAELVVEGATAQLLWSVRVTHPDALGVDYAVRIDALSGTVVAVVHQIDESTVRKVKVRHFRHKSGELDDRTFPTTDQNPKLSVTSINVNTVPLPLGGGLWLCQVRLQRLGSGRARMWNAALNSGTTNNPVFGYDFTWTLCPNVEQVWRFRRLPDQTLPFAIIDPTDQFNAQQVYMWAQRLKTQIDNWGRKAGSSYGYYYPVVGGRDENFELVVNGPSSAESTWCGGGVLHGCSVNNSDRAAWFQNVTSTPNIVFFFNDGNSSSPQFVGTENSAVYSIVAHEVGHGISWQYGRNGSSDRMRRSRSEGWSMAISAIWGKSRWTSNLDYDEEINVTTGSFAGTSNQWQRHTSSTLERYDTQDCEEANFYRLAWPWIQAMWELVHNRNEDTGLPIWATSGAAADNTADFLMNAMYDLADSTSATWRDVAVNMYMHQWFRILFFRERGRLPTTFSQTVQVLNHHGLLSECQ